MLISGAFHMIPNLSAALLRGEGSWERLCVCSFVQNDINKFGLKMTNDTTVLSYKTNACVFERERMYISFEFGPLVCVLCIMI